MYSLEIPFQLKKWRVNCFNPSPVFRNVDPTNMEMKVTVNLYIGPVTVYQGFRDTNIGQRIIGDFYSKNFTLSIGISMYRYAKKYTFYQTESFIVLCCLHIFNHCLHFSIFVHSFLLFRSHRGAAEIV